MCSFDIDIRRQRDLYSASLVLSLKRRHLQTDRHTHTRTHVPARRGRWCRPGSWGGGSWRGGCPSGSAPATPAWWACSPPCSACRRRTPPCRAAARRSPGYSVTRRSADSCYPAIEIHVYLALQETYTQGTPRNIHFAPNLQKNYRIFLQKLIIFAVYKFDNHSCLPDRILGLQFVQSWWTASPIATKLCCSTLCQRHVSGALVRNTVHLKTDQQVRNRIRIRTQSVCVRFAEGSREGGRHHFSSHRKGFPFSFLSKTHTWLEKTEMNDVHSEQRDTI